MTRLQDGATEAGREGRDAANRRPDHHAPMKSKRSRVSRRVLFALLAVAAGLLLPVYAATTDRPRGKIELNRTGRVMLFALLVWAELTALSLLWLAWVVVAWVLRRSGRSD